MRKTIFLTAYIFFAITAAAQSKDEQAIRSVMAAQTTAWNNGNINAFMETYWKSDSLVFIGKSGPTYGWQVTLDNYKKRYPDTVAMGKLTFGLLQLKPLPGNYYFVIGKWDLKRTIGDIGGFFTLLFKKVDGRWVIISDHTS